MCRTIQINGKQHYLWRAVNQDDDVVDVDAMVDEADGELLCELFCCCRCCGLLLLLVLVCTDFEFAFAIEVDDCRALR